MAEKPFLFFARPTDTKRQKLGGGGGKYRLPTPEQQNQRLQQRFEQIAAGLRDIQNTIAGAEPEQVIVIETLAEAVENVAKAASQIPGLEWLAERDLEEVEPELGFQDEKDPEKRVPRRLYALFSNLQAMDELLGLWGEWQAEPAKRAKRGFGPFKHLFSHLRDIRRWGPQDRIADTGLLQRWQEDIDVKGAQGDCPFEVEFWFRSDPAKREQLAQEVQDAIAESGGEIIDHAVISEIRYHAILASLPANVVQQTLQLIADQRYTRLLNCEGVMFFRPQGQSMFELAPIERSDFNLAQRLADVLAPQGEPLVALLDGLPLENHSALQGRIIIDDPDDHAAHYEATQQQHGTAMASLIIHGDLNGSSPPLANPVYVRPILHFDALAQKEQSPPRRLLVDVIHRAVHRIFEPEGENPPSAPSVRIVNLSIGDPTQPFLREMSSLARLLDWLAWRYKVLFIVSAGNCNDPISITSTCSDWRELSGNDLTLQVLTAMRSDQFRRLPFSPAESVNCLTVGAVHADDCPAYERGARIDLFPVGRLISPINTIASGFRRATKPEVLLPGGRMLFDPPVGDGADPARFTPSVTTNAPGQLTACPGTAFETGRVSYSCGTSNAAALASRCAAVAAGVLSAYEVPPDCSPLDEASLAVLLKGILVHAASWDRIDEPLGLAFGEEFADWRDRNRLMQKFLGYGEVKVDRCYSSTDQRATLLGWSSIGADEGQIFRLPLPPSLSASTEWRRLTVTLAWFTPTDNQHKSYRAAQLFLKVPNSGIGTPKSSGLDTKSAQRGTVEHRVYTGEEAEAFVDGTNLEIQVSCRPDGGKLNERVPYAIVASLEVAQTSQIAIYEEVRLRVRPQVEIVVE